MEHAYDAQRSVTPWRTAAIVAAAVAAVELFALVLLGVIVGAKLMTDKAETIVAQTQASKNEAATAGTDEPTTQAGNTAPIAALPRSRTSVIVLNGNGIPAAAAVGSDRVRKFDYVIAGTGNAPRTDFQRSVVMFREGFKGEALRLAKDLKIRRVTPLDGLTKRDLRGAHLAYVVGG